MNERVLDIEAATEKLLDFYDADDLVDVLQISAEELLDRFPDKVEEYLTSGNNGGPTEFPTEDDEDEKT